MNFTLRMQLNAQLLSLSQPKKNEKQKNIRWPQRFSKKILCCFGLWIIALLIIKHLFRIFCQRSNDVYIIAHLHITIFLNDTIVSKVTKHPSILLLSHIHKSNRKIHNMRDISDYMHSTKYNWFSVNFPKHFNFP